MRLRRPAVLDRVRRAPRNADFDSLQIAFLVAAIATVVVIRTQLWLTNYPQLGGGGLHIAHLLYGGVFMVIAIGILVTLLGRSPRLPAAIVGGVGFGFFIDELGKFITADNDYFFEPAAALIYLVFVGLFLLIRAFRRQRGLSPSECLSNAIDMVGEASRHDFDENDKRRALELLGGADPANPLVEPLRRLVNELPAVPARRPTPLARFADAVRGRYLRLIEWPSFRPAIGWIFAIWALLSLLGVLHLSLTIFGWELGGARDGFESDSIGHLSVLNWASIASSTVSLVLVAIGLWRLRRGSRLEAYRMFDRALLVAIFVTRVFAFVESQFGAVLGLAVDVLLWATVRYMADQERRLERAGEPGARSPAGAAAPATASG